MKRMHAVGMALALGVSAVAGIAYARSGWGALAYNTGNGRWGFAYDKEGQLAADNFAYAECGAGCGIVVRFGPGQCGAFARGSGTSWGKGWGANRSQAEANAVAECNSVAPGTCAPKVWGCNSR